jgi:colanic acid/amylovoran biosynthesis protein
MQPIAALRRTNIAHDAQAMNTISNETLNVALFGASPDTANMGVSALYRSFLYAMAERLPGLRPIVFDNGFGLRHDQFTVQERQVPLRRIGARGGHRYYRGENLRTMAALSSLPFGAALNQGLALIDSCSAIMDVSGGDSFSDIYGRDRFRNIVLPKIISVRRGRPLLLLPQTYGPFKDPELKAWAREAVLGAGQAWSRDLRSHEILKDLLGNQYDPKIHRTGVDMAFGLVPVPPPQPVIDALADWFEGATPVIGLNISGMVWGVDGSSAAAFGFKADYRELLRSLLEWILETSDVNVLLVPHVFGRDGATRTDSDASSELVASLSGRNDAARRIRIAPDLPNEQQLKWLIARTSWFCGTRMHATIAGLSSSVPTATISYSDKARGVFETVGQGAQIVDPRHASTEACLARLQELFDSRHDIKASLAESVAAVKARLAEQMDDIARFAVTRA